MGALDDTLHAEIAGLCEMGDQLAAAGHFHEALKKYHHAWQRVPEPKEDWEAATWILAAIGDSHFSLNDFDRARSALANALRCPNGIGNPFVHLRMGQVAFELGDEPQAANELTRAYMGAGAEIFEQEDPKYFNFLQTVIDLSESP